MNHIYKTIWNKSKNAFDVVAENVSTKGKKTAGSSLVTAQEELSTRQFSAVLAPLAAMLFVQSIGANVTVDDTGTQVYNAKNGVQVIDIATANSAGISHNRYVNYNVDPSGQVLNNAMQTPSQLTVMTELAGKIMTNANLNTSAKVILNEVTGTSRSALNGHIEVAGAKADVIIANPYGITCSGCGFINTDQATLTTGTPKFSAGGNLTHFNISQGNITVNGAGLNANSTSLLRLLSRSLNVDAQVNAQQLEAVAGANQYDYATGKTTAIAGTDAAVQYAIDSTQLGGIYANRIRLISTEQGVGVRMAGDAAASAEDFTLNASGEIELKNKISAKQNINIQNNSAQLQNLNIAGTLTSSNIRVGNAGQNNLKVNLSGGTLYADKAIEVESQSLTADDAKIQAKLDLSLNTSAKMAMHNSLVDAGNLHVSSGEFIASDSLLNSAKDITLNTAQDITLNNSNAAANRDISLKASQGNLDLAGVKLKGQHLSLEANKLLIDAEASVLNIQIQAHDQLTIAQNAMLISQNKTSIDVQKNADLFGKLYSTDVEMNIAGTLNSGKDTLISVQNSNIVKAKDINLNGTWEATDLTINAENRLKQEGSAYALNHLSLNANTVDVYGTAVSGQKFSANAKQDLTLHQQAGIESSDSLELNAQNIQLDGYAAAVNVVSATAENHLNTGEASKLESNGTLNLTSKNADVNLKGSTYATQQNITAKNSINTAQTAQAITAGNLQLMAQALNNSGSIRTQSKTKAVVKKIQNQGQLSSGKFDLSTLDSLTNGGRIISDQDLVIQTAELKNEQDALIASNQNLKVYLSGNTLNNMGSIVAMNHLDVIAQQAELVNSGLLSAGLQLNADVLKFENNSQVNASNVQVTAAEVKNTASIIGNTVKLKANKKADSTLENSGAIFAANLVDLTAVQDIKNTGNIYTVNQQELGAVNLTAQVIQNQSSGVISTNKLHVSADQIVNDGQISADEAIILANKLQKTALSNNGKASNNAGIYIYKSLQAENLSHLNNTGDIYVNLNGSQNSSLIQTEHLNNANGAYLFLGNHSSFSQQNGKAINRGEIYVQGLDALGKTQITLDDLDNASGILNIDWAKLFFVKNFNNTGKLNALNNAEIQAKNLKNAGDINLYNADIAVTNLENNSAIKASGTAKIKASNTIQNNKLIHAEGNLYLDAKNLKNAEKAGIIALNNLNLNTEITEKNTFENSGDVFAANFLTIGNEQTKQTDVLNKMNTNMAQVSGGNLQAGNGLKVFGHNFINNYNVLTNAGDIQLVLLGKFENERTYYGNKINITETWKTPQMYLTSDNDWGDESFNDSASNTIIYTTQVAIKGGGDDGVQGSIVTETWKKSTDVQAGAERDYNTIKNYLNGDIGQAKIGANNGNIIINYVNDSKNIGGKIYAAGNGAGAVNINGTNNFTNQSLDLYRDQLFELKYLLLTDHSNRAGAVVSLDSKNPSTIQLSNIDDDGDFNRSNNYIDAIKGLSGIYYSYQDSNTNKSTTVTDRTGDNYTVTYNVKNVIDAIRNKVKLDGFKALLPKNVQSDTAQSKATVTGNTVYIKAKNLTNESESNLNHLALNNDKKLCENLGLTCQIDKPADDKKENADAPDNAADVDAPKKQVDSTKYTEDVRIQPVNPISQVPVINLTLPVSDYGQYITAKDPNSKYLVESNPLYGEKSNVIGSDYLQNKLGINPDAVMKRLGDNGYELNLVQQQLISALGTAVLYANSSMSDQMQKLFDHASEQSSSLGLTYGKALTSDQMNHLTQDMVWMVSTEVAGQTVLVPQVYLSKATIDSISSSGAVIAGKNLTYLEVDALDNKNAAIRGGNVVVDAKKDINNIGAQIKGGNVFLTSKEGSINNITQVHTAGSDADRKTSIGAVSSIVSDGVLVLDAAKDINNIGAKLKAGGTAALKAGDNINILSIQDSEASSQKIKNGRSTTSTVTNMGSVVEAGENIILDSGHDTTIKGSDITAGGVMYAKTGGDFKLLADQDTTETKSMTSRSGFGVGGGIWGSETVEKTDFKGTNKASNLNVGSLIIDSEGKAVIEGSNIGIRDKDSLSLIRGKAGVDILDGKDEERHEKTTTTTTYLKSTKGSSSNNDPIYGTAANDLEKDKKRNYQGNATQKLYGNSTEDEPNTQVKASAGTKVTKLSASAQAGASASTKGDAALKISEKTKTVEKSGSSSSVASNIISAGSLSIMSDSLVNVRGSNVDVDGALAIAAKDLLVEAGKNTSYASRDMSRTSVGIFAEGDAAAQANAQAGAKAGVNGASASVSAGASAEANGTVTFGAKHEKESESMNSLTHSKSSLKSGSDMLIKVQDTATFQGADVQAGQWDKDGNPRGKAANLRIEAKDIKNLAVQDTHDEKRSSSSKLAGIYISGNASAEAGAQAGVSADVTNPNSLSAGASASASASAEAGVGLRTAIENSDESYNTVTNQGNNFRSTGSFVRIAENSILDQATQVNAGSMYQSAASIKDEAVNDSQTFRSSSQSHEARIGLYAEAGVSAGVSAQASLGATASAGAGKQASGATERDPASGSSKPGPKLAVGVSAQYSSESSSANSKDTQARSSSFVSSGDITSISSAETQLNGTQFASGGNINLEASKLSYNAVHDTHESDSSSRSIDINAKVGIDVKGTPDVEAGAAYGQNKSKANSSTAIVGGLSAAGNINVKATEQASFEGTQLSSGNAVTVQSNNTVFKAAESDSSSSSTGFNVGASFENAQKSTKQHENVQREVTGNNASGPANDVRQAGGVSAGFDIEKSSKTTYTGSTITANQFQVIGLPSTQEGAPAVTPTATMENVKFQSLAVDSKGNPVEDTSINQTNTSLVKVTANTKKDQKSGFELGGQGSIDSGDLRQIRTIKDAYAGTGTAGQTRQSTETLTLNDPNNSEHSSQKTISVNMKDAIGGKVTSIINALKPVPTVP